MNFSREGIEKQRNELQASASMAGNRLGVLLLRLIVLALVVFVVAAVFLIRGAYQGILDGSPDISDVNIMPAGYATFVYDADGNQMQKLSSASGNRISVSISEIPADMQHAIVAIEDSRFYEHNGVDPRGMLRAAVVAVQSGFSGTEGASTITQQLLKNNVFTDFTQETRSERIKRKFQEQYLAIQLEKSLADQGRNPKDVILENYLNTVNFGAGSYGIQTASMTYFGKSCKELTLSECAVLAAIPQNPSKYNPLRYPEYNAERAETVLEYMLSQGYITQEAYSTAMADNVYERIQEHADSGESIDDVYSYFIDELVNRVKTDLINQKGYTEVQANNALFSGGLNIYTTQDPKIQKIMDQEFTNSENFPELSTVALDWALTVKEANGNLVNYSREMLQLYFRDSDESFDLLFDSEEEAQEYVDRYKDEVVGAGDEIVGERISFIPQPQAAMAVIDQRTGYVKGIVGGRGEKTASLTLNRATDSYRQPGSTFKILSTYGPALDKHYITLATTEKDEPYEYETGQPVKNADESYHGTVTVRKAIQNSYNVIAVKILTEITPQTGMDYLERLGFTKLINDPAWDVIQSLALGGITNGVSTLELTAAYAAIANGGTYTEPMFYTKVTDHEGNVILETTPLTTKVFKESTSFLLTSAMEDVVSDGTGQEFALEDMHVAGKTGTTNAYRDLVFAGFTPYYTAAIWAGCDVTVELPVEYRHFHETLWQTIMQRIHKELKLRDTDFTKPANIEEVEVCATTGLLPGSICPRATEYFETGTEPKTRCTEHVYVPPTPAPQPRSEDNRSSADEEENSSDEARMQELAEQNGGEDE
ncbi:MAG: transglycosylase domain-containing protein [Eubacterium sp.]|nr:transglycosylase domain-containing protein [Eubacterium sp.]